MDRTLVIETVMAALDKGGCHMTVYPDGQVSIWPENMAPGPCKDCKHCENDGDGDAGCAMSCWFGSPPEDMGTDKFFCALWEGKEC